MNYITLLQSISISNKYYKWYANICQRAINRNLSNVYTEKHHIVPKSLGLGGEKDKRNLCSLTAKEHYIAHMLLVRFLAKEVHQKKMVYAMWYLSTRNINFKPTSRTYEVARLKLVAAIKSRNDSIETRRKKARHGNLNGMYGKTHSTAVKETLSKIAKARLTGKSYAELYGEDKANLLKQDRSKKLKTYLESNPNARKGANNSNSKTYKFTDRNGQEYTITGGLKNFCQEHKLSVSAIIDIVKGRRAEYKGWTAKYC